MDKVDFRAVSGKDFGRIIVAVIDGETWISGTDAAKATGHVWTDFAVDRFVKDSDKRTADIPDSQIVVSRNGLHSLAAESRKPYAEKAEKAIIEAVFLQENENETECVEENKETINSNGITIFNNAEFGEVRTIEDNGQILFCGKDIAKALGYSNTKDALIRHCRWVVKHDLPHPQSPSKMIEMSFIPEGDVIRLAAHSKLKGAERLGNLIVNAIHLQEQEEKEMINTDNSSGLTIFSNEEFGNLRTLETEDGKVLFCGADIAKALGYTNTQKAVRDHCKEDGVTICSVIDSMGRNQEAKFITEGNVYRLITHSKLPNAELFEAWVFDEVLPSIRKTGSYTDKSVQEEVHKTENVQDEKDNDMIKFSVNTLVEIAKADCLLTSEKRTILAKATEMLLGEKIISVDNTEEDSNIVSTDMTECDAEEKLYSATEVGNMFGLSRQKIIYLAKQNNIRDNEEYGRFQLFYNVNIFCYNEKAVARFREILSGNQLVIDVIA